MNKKAILIIKSESRNDKYIYIAENNVDNIVKTLKVKNDLMAELKEFLEKEGYKLSDFEDFKAIKTESFTGYREAVNICNIFKRYLKNVKIAELEFPIYHKEPNITTPK